MLPRLESDTYHRAFRLSVFSVPRLSRRVKHSQWTKRVQVAVNISESTALDDKMLTQEQVNFYDENGYICIEGFATPEECKAMIEKAGHIVDDFNPKQYTIFSANNTAEQNQFLDKFFLDSSKNISCFFEEKAFDEKMQLQQPKGQSINKIGHALHELDPTFHAFGSSARMKGLLKDLGYKQPVPVQSTFIFKQPRIGGQVSVHQDATFLYTNPPTVIGLWVALEDATKENGCLWSLPGSHKEGQPRRRFVRDEKGKLDFDKPSDDFDLSEFVPLECKAGTMIAIHALNQHYSADNHSSKSRCAYILHAYEGPEENFAGNNWLQRFGTPLPPIYSEA